MTDISAIKAALHEGIEAGDERLLKMMLRIMKEYNQPLAVEDEIAHQRKALIRRERERYLRGEGKSFTWDEVKQLALSRSGHDEL